ncbi:MAG: DUF3108 domain-containing protein [Nitrospiria bacterium]
MKKIFPLLLFVLFLAIPHTQAVESVVRASIPKQQKIKIPFRPGERLVYDVNYFNVPAGTAVMEVVEKGTMKGRDVFHILSTVRSNKMTSLFYRVRDRIETFIDAEGLYSHFIRIKQRQGGKKREKIIDFDQVQHRAVQIKKNKRTTYTVPPRVHDSLSSLYYFRAQPSLESGKSVFIDVHESRKNWVLEIQVLGREEVTTALGTFKAIKAKALVHYEGLFMDKGDVTLWLTDDAQRIPVLIRTKIRIGSINIELRSMQGVYRL